MAWQPPPAGWVKVTSDGSVLASKKAACGGLVRDDAGCFMRGFAALGSCPVTIVELWGVVYALGVVQSMDYSHIILEMDSACAIQLILCPLDNCHPFVGSSQNS